MSSGDHEPFDRLLAASERARTDGDPVRGAEAAEAAVAVARAAEDRAGAARAGAQWAHHLWRLGRTTESAEIAEQILGDVDELPDVACAVDLRNTLSMVLCDLGSPAAAIPHAVSALEIARRDGDPGPLSWALNRLSAVYSALGDNVRATELLRQAIDVAEACPDPEPGFSSRFNLATTLERLAEMQLEHGDLDAGQEVARQSLAAAEQAVGLAGERDHWLMYYHLLRCKNLDMLGRIDEMKESVERFQELARSLSLTHFQNIGEIMQARWLYACGRVEESSEWLRTRVDWSAADVDELVRRWILQLQVKTDKALGRFESALAAHEALVSLERRNDRQRLGEQARMLLREAEIHAAHEEADRLRRRSADLAARFAAATQEARVDPLTGLANRRALDLRLRDELVRSATSRYDLVVAMVDGDHFKAINDTHGHDAGDEVLRRLSRILRAGVRDGDYVARNGGEEFVLLLAGRSLAAAEKTCERIRRSVADHDWAAVVPGTAVTISIGLSKARIDDDAPTLLRRADAAMYRAKRAGRNRVVVDAMSQAPALD